MTAKITSNNSQHQKFLDFFHGALTGFMPSSGAIVGFTTAYIMKVFDVGNHIPIVLSIIFIMLSLSESILRLLLIFFSNTEQMNFKRSICVNLGHMVSSSFVLLISFVFLKEFNLYYSTLPPEMEPLWLIKILFIVLFIGCFVNPVGNPSVLSIVRGDKKELSLGTLYENSENKEVVILRSQITVAAKIKVLCFIAFFPPICAFIATNLF